MNSETLSTIIQHLDRELRAEDFPDDSAHNGLQVENSGTVRKVCCGVDASLDFFEKAKSAGADLCIVHHGLSWGTSLARITDLNYRLIRYLLENDLALYASHLPLDAHPTLGNNAVLAGALGLRSLEPFGLYHGMRIGMRGMLPRALSPEAFQVRLANVAPGGNLVAMLHGPDRIRSVGVVSGGGADELPQAVAAGLDAFVSGEGGLQAYNQARQSGIHAFFAGHYATETFGVKALGTLIRETFGLPSEFIDFRLPY